MNHLYFDSHHSPLPRKDSSSYLNHNVVDGMKINTHPPRSNLFLFKKYMYNQGTKSRFFRPFFDDLSVFGGNG